MTNFPISSSLEKAWKKLENPLDLLKTPQPQVTSEYDTGAVIPDEDQEKFKQELQWWLNKNQKFIVNYYKMKHKEELDRAQTAFDFVKDL